VPYGTGIIRGMALTFSKFFTKPITLQYPKEKRVLPERSRGELYLNRFEEGNLKCRACFICVKTCPDGLIDIQTTRFESGEIMIEDWRWESHTCMFCGLCRDSCPYDALHMNAEYELSKYNLDALWRSLVKHEMADRPKREPKPAVPPEEQVGPWADHGDGKAEPEEATT
jgi:NADH-quinone oxidoreductase subunit I